MSQSKLIDDCTYEIPESAVSRRTRSTSLQLRKSSFPPMSIVDKWFVLLRRIHPSYGEERQWQVYNEADFIKTTMALMHKRLAYNYNANPTVLISDMVKNTPFIISIGGMRGSKKSTLSESLSSTLKELSINSTILHMDSYFIPREQQKCLGGNENPRNTDINAVLRDIKGFKRGEIVAIRTGDYGTGHVKVDPKKSPVLIVEGIHALSVIRISKNVDIRSFIILDPMAQFIRAIKRDLGKQRALYKGPGYYYDINKTGEYWHKMSAALRSCDANIILTLGRDAKDIEALSKIPDGTQEEIDARQKAWKNIS